MRASSSPDASGRNSFRNKRAGYRCKHGRTGRDADARDTAFRCWLLFLDLKRRPLAQHEWNDGGTCAQPRWFYIPGHGGVCVLPLRHGSAAVSASLLCILLWWNGPSRDISCFQGLHGLRGSWLETYGISQTLVGTELNGNGCMRNKWYNYSLGILWLQLGNTYSIT